MRPTSRTSPASAASPTSSARRSTRAGITRSPRTSSASSICRAARSTGSGRSRSTSSTTSSSARRWCAASRRAASARATSRAPDNIQGAALGGTTLLRRLGRSRLPDLRPAEGDRAEGRAVRRRRQPDRLRRPDELLELPRATPIARDRTCLLITQPSCANVWDPNVIRSVGRRELDLGVAAGSDPVRLRLPVARASTTRPRSSISRAARRSSLERPELSDRGRVTGWRARRSHLTEPAALAKIRFFPPSCAPTLAEVAVWCGAALAADSGRRPRDPRCRRARPGRARRSDLPRQSEISRRVQGDARRRRARRAAPCRRPRRRAAPRSSRASPIARWRR